jgi:hypothetical protein
MSGKPRTHKGTKLDGDLPIALTFPESQGFSAW